MTKAYEEARGIYRVSAPLDKALEILGEPISMAQLAEARMQVGENHSLNTDGSYCAEGFVYAKNAEPIIRRKSFLLDSELARKAVEANRAGRYFTTEDGKLYERARAQAERDKDESPEKRKAIILPSKANFIISPEENPEIFEFLLGKKGQKYLAHAERNNLIIYIVNDSTVNSQSGTLLTQSWLRGVDDVSGVNGSDRGLDFDFVVRGVHAPVGASSGSERTQKISGNVRPPYTMKQLDKMAKIVRKVREGNLPNSTLESITDFIENLRKA